MDTLSPSTSKEARTVRVKADTYDQLANMGKVNTSFDDVIRSLIASNKKGQKE